jgi:hypothetical protein
VRRATAASLYRPQRVNLPFNRHPLETVMGRSILLWLLGVPIPIIILLALFWR